MDGLDARILAAVTRRGRRLLTYAELVEVGASEKEILGRVRRGSLQRVHAGVYLVGAGELTWQETILAAVLAGGETALASVFCAVRLWGIATLAPGLVDVDVAHGTEVQANGVRVHRTRRALPSSVVQGVPCVAVEEALLGVASRVPVRTLHRLLTTAWRVGLTTPRKVLLHLEHFGGSGVRGTRKLRAVATIYDEHSRGPGSEAEADFVFDLYQALDEAGIERPELQFVIEVYGGTEKVVPDFVWPTRWKVIEMKGLLAHGDYVVHDEDHRRASAIRAAGYDLEEITPRAMRERPKQTIERLIAWLQTPALRRP